MVHFICVYFYMKLYIYIISFSPLCGVNLSAVSNISNIYIPGRLHISHTLLFHVWVRSCLICTSAGVQSHTSLGSNSDALVFNTVKVHTSLHTQTYTENTTFQSSNLISHSSFYISPILTG